MIYFFSCLVNVYLVVVRLNYFLKEGKVLKDCLYFKFINNMVVFILVNLYFVLDLVWNRGVC